MRLNNHILFFVLLFFLPIIGWGQFSRYWGESFSTKSALLSGAVVGGYQDEASIYYNPSILSDSSVNQFSLANGVLNVDYLRYENAIGDRLDVSTLESSVNAGFLSANLYPKDKFHLVWKAAYFNRSKFDHSLDDDVIQELNSTNSDIGNEQYIGNFSTRTEFNDYWYGLGIAKFVNQKLSFGISGFLRYTSLRYHYSKSIEISALIADTNQRIALANDITKTRGYNWRGTVKLGANFRFSKIFSGGITITSPSIYFASSTSASRNVTHINNPDPSGTGLLPDYFYDSSGDQLKLNVKDPLSIAFGVDYRLRRLRWNVTAEWFAGLSPYRVIDERKGEVDVLKSGYLPELEEEVLSFVSGGKSIVNTAIGVEIYNKNDRSLLLGFKTDFDALKGYDYGELDHLNTFKNARTNYYHFSAGKNFQFLKYDVLFGLQYSISRQKGLPAYANFSTNGTIQDNPPYEMEGPIENNMQFKGDALTVFLGLTIKN